MVKTPHYWPRILHPGHRLARGKDGTARAFVYGMSKSKTQHALSAFLLTTFAAAGSAQADAASPPRDDHGLFGVISPLRLGGSMFERVVYSESPSNSAEPRNATDVMFGLGLGYRVGKLSVELGMGVGGGNVLQSPRCDRRRSRLPMRRRCCGSSARGNVGFM